VHAHNTHVGRLADLTVRQWLENNASLVCDLPYLLISSMDSDRLVSSMPWVSAHRLINPDWTLSLFPLVVSGASTVALLEEDRLFTGFDELWIPARLPVAEPPDDAYLVAPRMLDVESPGSILQWLRVSGCRLGIGDGGGMNYAVADSALGRDFGLL